MKKILVTGGAGFIGSNFIRYMLNKYADYQIVNLDKLTYAGNLQNLKDIEDDPRYRFVRGDICDKELVSGLMRECDTVVNFAAESHVDRSIKEAGVFVRTNVLGTCALLQAAEEEGVDLFCQISTDEVYGSREQGYFKETDLLKPSSPYSASKAAADQLVHSYYVTYNLPVTIIRFTNNFGPYQFPEKIIPLFIGNALEDKKLPVYGDGRNVRDWIYVLDTCRTVDFILHNGKSGEIYNAGGGNEINNIELTRRILELMDKPQELIEFVEDRPGHDRRYALDSSKIRELGFEPCYNFERALRETVEWYCASREWRRHLAGKI